MRYLIFCFLCMTLASSAQEDKLKWFTDFEKAKQKSEKTEKPILMYFTGSDWCAPCKMLHADFFASAKFGKQAKKLILLKVDMPRRVDVISEEQRTANTKLVKKYNPNKSFPTIIAMNHKGKIIDTISAYSTLRDPSNYFSFVERLLTK